MEYTIDTFDWEFYINEYKDLRDAGILTKEKAWWHWCTYGCKENRLNRKINYNFIKVSDKSSLTTNTIKNFLKNDKCNIFIKRSTNESQYTNIIKSKSHEYLKPKNHDSQYYIELLYYSLLNNDIKTKCIYVDFTTKKHINSNRKYKSHKLEFETKIINNDSEVDTFYYIKKTKKFDFLYIKTYNYNILSLFINKTNNIIVRGYINNPKIYDFLIEDTQLKYKIYYPCESFHCYENDDKKNSVTYIHKDYIERFNKFYIFDFIVCGSSLLSNKLNNIYKTNKFIYLHKIYKNIENGEKETEYDIIYTSSIIGSTKSTNSLFYFIKFLKDNNLKLKIAILIKNLLFSEEGKGIWYKKIKELNYEYLTILINKDTQEYYKSSKCNLIMSSKDSCPRVMFEAIKYNTKNIIFDTLTEGKDIAKYSKMITCKNVVYNDHYKVYQHDPSKKDEFWEIYNYVKSYQNENNPKTIKSKMINENIITLNNVIKKKCLLFISYNPPGYGGASTNIYEFYNYYKNIYDCYALFIEKNINISKQYFKNINDKNIFSTNERFFNENELNNNIDSILEILSKYDEVTIIYKIKKTYNNIIKKYFNAKIFKLIYLISGLDSINVLLNRKLGKKNKNKWPCQDTHFLNKSQTDCTNIVDYINDTDKYVEYEVFENELEPILNSYKSICNSNMTLELTNKLNNIYKSKINLNKLNICNTSIIFKKLNDNNLDFQKRDIDIIFSCSLFGRLHKNANFMLKIFKDPRLKKYKKCIVGNKYPLNIINNLDNTIYYENLPKQYFINILERSKLLFITSIYDSMPNLLYDGICHNCNILVSQSIDNPFKNNINSFNLSDSKKNIIDKIILNIENQYNINKNKFNKIKNDEIRKFKMLLDI